MAGMQHSTIVIPPRPMDSEALDVLALQIVEDLWMFHLFEDLEQLLAEGEQR